jgi:hypothetical protein
MAELPRQIDETQLSILTKTVDDVEVLLASIENRDKAVNAQLSQYVRTAVSDRVVPLELIKALEDGRRHLEEVELQSKQTRTQHELGVQEIEDSIAAMGSDGTSDEVKILIERASRAADSADEIFGTAVVALLGAEDQVMAALEDGADVRSGGADLARLGWQ